MSYSISPPQGSPEDPAAQPAYFHENVPRGDISSESKSKRQSALHRASGSGLGIQMAPITVKSPGSAYQSSPQVPPPDNDSPLPIYSQFPSYMQTPGSARSFMTTSSRARTDPMTERLIQHRATQAAQWTVHWRTPTLMVVSFLTGVIFAFCQHRLYAALHHKAEADEDRKIRVVLYGRALAYLSKVAFSNCVLLCYRQRIWRTFRERALSVLSIDRLFLGAEDPSIFLCWETISKATLVTGMALLIWLLPVATIVFSPAALTFGDTLKFGNQTLRVPTLNFSAEMHKDWRVAVETEGVGKRKSLVFYNTTDVPGKAEGYFDYYDQPSADLKRISIMTGYSIKDQPLNREDARLKSCGGDYNCTYTIEFRGPGYKCEELARGPEDDVKLAKAGVPFNTSILVPRGKHAYYANVTMGDYLRPQPATGGLDESKGGKPIGDTPEDFGYFKAEPMLYIGYAINSTVPLEPPIQNWTHRYDQYVFACTHFETDYTVKTSYSGPFFNTTISYEFKKPIVDTEVSLNDGQPDELDIDPVSNYITPHDKRRYRLVAAYHAMGQRFRSFLEGHIELQPPFPGPSYAKVYSEITSTRLVNDDSTPRPEFHKLIQEFYVDMILSLFSAPEMLVVSETEVLVSRTRYQSTFVYNKGKLWGCYAPVIFFVLLSLILGAVTIHGDGTTFSVGFSRIMVTTRNTTLDEISRGACLGNDPFPPELMHTRLKFGVLNEGGHEQEYQGLEGYVGASHCAFGVPSELTPIQRGGHYAGLPRRRDGDIMRRQKNKVD